MKIEDPKTGKKVDAIKRKYRLKMKTGTTGTMLDSHRPNIADFLEDRAGDWSVNEGEGSIQIDCPEEMHKTLVEDPKELIETLKDNPEELVKALALPLVPYNG